MGKKKGYYVSELFFKPEENTNIEKPESFTVKDYDAIVDEVVNEQPSKQLNADPKKEGIDNDIPSDVRQTDTQEVEVEFYDLDVENDVVNEQPSKQVNADPKKDEIDGSISNDVHKTDTQDIVNGVANEQPIKQLNTDPGKDGVDGDISSDSSPTDTKDLAIANEVVNDQPCEQLNEDPVKDEIDDDDSSSDSDKSDTQDANAIEPVSYKKFNDTEDDNQLKKDANSQSTAIIDDAKSNLDTGASAKQASATESSNLKAAEKFTSIELGEIKHEPKNNPAINWFKRNRFFVIGIVVIVVLIVAISIPTSSRKKPTSTANPNEIPLSSTTEFAGPRKGTLPPGVYPAAPDVIENTEDFDITKTSSIAPSLEPTTIETTTQGGINGNTIAASVSPITTGVSSTATTTDEYDYHESSGDSGDPSAPLSLFENV
ncbi:acidic repeat-containing protein-like isoform X2 [Daphnia pulex]|uniref:acidic repeat-containing protein-like isoform X2 n=1 Tax=Daphnia pulex TaxID=6669 RepID=UPI001EDD1F4D|nr:acidic repeat-containing protein-like isoform X2 [Daphnia pulex]